MWAGREEVGVAVAEKRKAFEEWLQIRDMDTYDRYWAQRAVVKQVVKNCEKNSGLAVGRAVGE